jgi:hypothetical protein
MSCVGEDNCRTGILDDPRRFARMELSVDRHGNRAGEPDAIQRFQIFGPIGHEDGNATARLHPEPFAKRSAQRSGAPCEFTVARNRLAAAQQCIGIGVQPGRTGKPFSGIHVFPPNPSSPASCLHISPYSGWMHAFWARSDSSGRLWGA